MLKNEIYIKGKFTTINEYVKVERANKHAAAKIKKKETYMAKVQSLGKKIETPCVLKFTWYVKNRRKDPDGISGMARKFVLDGLVDAGVIPNDTMRYIKGFVEDFVVAKEEGVKVERVEE